jgi:mannose-6-phosphate isomerase-like protein (cupin superfamily)
MIEEKLLPGRGTCLRRNKSNKLSVSINCDGDNKFMVINGTSLIAKHLQHVSLNIKSNDYYMIINTGKKLVNIKYNHDVSEHDIIYDPYKYEHSEKINFDPNEFVKEFSVPSGYIDILSKWYSIKFTYPEFNIIFIKPEMGISIQIHTQRSEVWEILSGKPIVINGDKIYYFVKDGTKFTNKKEQFHSIINPNRNPIDFVSIKERWSGSFDEEDIKRIYNPNNYK